MHLSPYAGHTTTIRLSFDHRTTIARPSHVHRSTIVRSSSLYLAYLQARWKLDTSKMRYGCVEEERRLKGQKSAHHTEKKECSKTAKYVRARGLQ